MTNSLTLNSVLLRFYNLRPCRSLKKTSMIKWEACQLPKRLHLPVCQPLYGKNWPLIWPLWPIKPWIFVGIHPNPDHQTNGWPDDYTCCLYRVSPVISRKLFIRFACSIRFARLPFHSGNTCYQNSVILCQLWASIVHKTFPPTVLAHWGKHLLSFLVDVAWELLDLSVDAAFNALQEPWYFGHQRGY